MPSFGRRPQRCDPGTTLVAPFSSVKSSSSQIELQNLVLARLHGLAPVNMQSLMALRGQGSAPVERKDLEILPVEDVGDSSQLPRIVPAEIEDGVLVNEVRQPVRAFFLMSLEARFVTLGGDEVVKTLDDLCDR